MRWILVLVLLSAACRGKKSEQASTTTGSNVVGAARSDATKDAVAAFWSWFVEHAAALRADDDFRRTMERVSEKLASVHPDVFAEIGAVGNERMLVLSAGGIKDLFPIVQELDARKPAVTGWKIVAFRPRGDLSLSIDLGGTKLAISAVKFVAERAGTKLDIRVFVPGYDGSDQMKQLGYLALDHTIGEYDMETKIGGIDFESDTRAPREAKSIAELPAAVDAIK